MRPADFIRSRLLDRKRKFIGLVSFPEAHFAAVRKDILQWILLREQEMGRQLGILPPSDLLVTDDHENGVKTSETYINSLVEFAASADLEQTGAALRYFHYFLESRGRGSAKRHVQIEMEGFLTTFVFQRNAAKKEIFLWIRLEYCHSSLWPARKMPPSTPRIFNEIIRKTPGVRILVHEQTDPKIIEKEWKTSATYEDIEAAVKRERRRRPRLQEPGGQTTPTTVETPVVESPPATGFAGRLEDLRKAIESLRDTCTHFFDKENS